MRILAFILLLTLPAVARGQVNPCDYGAIPNDGRDDSRAFASAFQEAIRSSQDVRIPEGVFDLKPVVHYVHGRLHIIGAGIGKTKLRRMENRSWTQRFRCQSGAELRFEGFTLDGNGSSLKEAEGDDQHHEIRIDQIGKTKMQSVALQSIGVYDLVADGFQFVHNGLQQVTVHSFENLGGGKGRRDLQFSYHPKSAFVEHSTFRDFSTEPAGGTKNRVNLTIQDCTITGSCNLQECGDLRARRLKINRLSSLTCDSGLAEQLSVASAGTIVGPSCIVIRDSRFEEPLKFWARFNRHEQDVTFERCAFAVKVGEGSVFSTIHPAAGESPEAKFAFLHCTFPAPLQLGNGYQFRVEDCNFTGDVGISVSARFGPSGSLAESGNTWAKTSIALQQVSSGHPFELNIEPETLKRLVGKGDYYPLSITDEE